MKNSKKITCDICGEELHFVCYKCQNELLTDRDAYKKGKLETAKEIFEAIEKMFSIPENMKGFAEKDEIAIRFITKKEWNKLKKQFLGGEDGR